MKLGLNGRAMLIACATLGGVIALSLSSAQAAGRGGGSRGGKPGGETAGNNLSYPVIWADGVAKVLPGTPGMTPALGGVWWYWWGTEGTDPDIIPLASPPDPDGLTYLDNQVAGTVDQLLSIDLLPQEPLVKAYLQKDPLNTWQAATLSAVPGEGNKVVVDWIDWGDNLESVDWYTRSQVRTEVVLFKDLTQPALEYEMRHVSGWGINEVHGLATKLDGTVLYGPGTRATVYSHCARLTIQKLLVTREDPSVADLVWNADLEEPCWTEPEEYVGDLINPPIFNEAVYDAGDGPGYYSAEINVKGRVIYGYTWNVRQLNDNTGGTAAGDYRLTFSFDDDGPQPLNTDFVEPDPANGVVGTQILVPLEEEVLEAAILAAAEEGEEPGGGAVAVLDCSHNLTYLDVRILGRTGGGGGGRP